MPTRAVQVVVESERQELVLKLGGEVGVWVALFRPDVLALRVVELAEEGPVWPNLGDAPHQPLVQAIDGDGGLRHPDRVELGIGKLSDFAEVLRAHRTLL